MGRQGIKLDKAHAFSSRFLQLCAQEEKALSQWGAIFHTTRQTISNWQTGESVPDIIKLADIAQYFGVSTDYLLGLSDTKSPDAGAKAAVEYTGLSEEAVERLHIGLDHFIFLYSSSTATSSVSFFIVASNLLFKPSKYSTISICSFFEGIGTTTRFSADQ